ncbi:MAG: hypothetical protein Q9M13_09575 [Mariprofundales bacterium]|nr:hypothetical protein [Mariprofundales bacterium]
MQRDQGDRVLQGIVCMIKSVCTITDAGSASRISLLCAAGMQRLVG